MTAIEREERSWQSSWFFSDGVRSPLLLDVDVVRFRADAADITGSVRCSASSISERFRLTERLPVVDDVSLPVGVAGGTSVSSQ